MHSIGMVASGRVGLERKVDWYVGCWKGLDWTKKMGLQRVVGSGKVGSG